MFYIDLGYENRSTERAWLATNRFWAIFALQAPGEEAT